MAYRKAAADASRSTTQYGPSTLGSSKDFREEEGAEVLQFVSTEISTFSHHQSQPQKPCNRNSRQKAPPQSMLVARMQV